MDRGFLSWLCVVAALVLSVVWLLSVTGVIGSSPNWVPPSGLFAAALALALSWIWAPRRL
jgi:hypothetical protein